ncbi:MAG: hypothetical protein RL607_1967 [Bacteroidota bacterium]|jgi:hypothetical protein
MKKILFLLSVVLLFCSFSCDIPYDGKRIIKLNHQFLDHQGQPVSGKKIMYLLGATQPFDGVNPEFEFTTDSNGRIQFSTFEPNEPFYVYAEGYANYLPVNSLVYNFETNQINTQKFYFLEASEVVTFQVQFQTNTPTKNVTRCTLEGIGNLQLYPDVPDMNYFFDVAKNQTLTVHYTVYNSQNNVTQTLSDTFTIGTGSNAVIINL